MENTSCSRAKQQLWGPNRRERCKNCFLVGSMGFAEALPIHSLVCVHQPFEALSQTGNYGKVSRLGCCVVVRNASNHRPLISTTRLGMEVSAVCGLVTHESLTTSCSQETSILIGRYTTCRLHGPPAFKARRMLSAPAGQPCPPSRPCSQPWPHALQPARARSSRCLGL